MTANPYRDGISRRSKTKTQKLYVERTLMNIEALKREEVFDYHVQAQVPEAWDTLEQDVDTEEPKVQITLRLDASVAKFYRAMGKGYQGRINRILATFAQMRMAQVKTLNDMVQAELDRVEELRRDYSLE